MTPEQILYHKLMLENGCRDSFDAALRDAVAKETQDAHVRALAACGGETADILRTLDGFLTEAENEPDRDAAFGLVLDDLRGRYERGELTVEQVCDWMHTVTRIEDTGLGEAMHLMDMAYCEMIDGFLPENEFMKCFRHLLHKKTAIDPWEKKHHMKPKRSAWEKLKDALHMS